ncbi:MAG: hypothetical protein KAH54_12340, partial [Candidatus Sabulitectum sp.]|nr:hypothetical protein [Candidatus Sabulitectum sp.]
MRYIATVLLSSVVFAGGMTGELPQPVEVVGSAAHLVTSFPADFSRDMEVTEPATLFEPPSEYGVVETLDCR